MARKASRHLGHGLLKAVREVAQPEKHRTREPNRWPRCDVCMHRVEALCPQCAWCAACCLGHDEDKETP